jgi:hypothetical protein
MPSGTNKLDQFNRNGAKLCDAFGCRKHARLRACYRGVFCAKHMTALASIRAMKGRTLTADDEIEWRTREVLLRKTMDAGHIHYINKLGLLTA